MERKVVPPKFPLLMEMPERMKKPLKGEKRALVLLVDFSDNQSRYPPSDFRELFFGDTGSLRDYYQEVSYENLSLYGEVKGWYTLGHSYSYYTDHQYGVGMDYPHNTQGMVADALKRADSDIDFSLYDGDNDGYVDYLVIVHAGMGAEETNSREDIWSHKWQLSDTKTGSPGPYTTNDGVKIDAYITGPESSLYGKANIGVFCHEFGHLLGLPDLYDTQDPYYVGPGKFSLMSSGAWNGSPPGSSPSHLCSWSKYLLGWIEPFGLDNPGDSIPKANFPAVEWNPVAYRLLPNPNGADWTFNYPGKGEYFLVENRYQTGFDKGLPGSGLLILHIDESQSDNNDQTHPLVGIIQADKNSAFSLTRDDQGRGEDLWSNDTSGFGFLSIPPSLLYDGTPSGVVIKNISAEDSVMEADLSLKVVLLGKVYSFPNPFIPDRTHKRVTIRYVPKDKSQEYPKFKVSIYNLAGELVRVLDTPNSEVYPLVRTAFWDLKNDRGEEVSSGLYFYLIETEDGERNKGKLTVIR